MKLSSDALQAALIEFQLVDPICHIGLLQSHEAPRGHLARDKEQMTCLMLLEVSGLHSHCIQTDLII